MIHVVDLLLLVGAALAATAGILLWQWGWADMGLDAVIRSALRTANSVTSSLQATVTHEAFSSATDYGVVTYATAVERTAIVEFKPRMVRTVTGEEKVSRANLMFVEPVSIDLRDRFTLPDGTTAPILALSTVTDPSTNAGYYQQVFL